LIVILGEDISRFRDASKELYDFLRSYSWSGKVERLGLDEVRAPLSTLIHLVTYMVSPIAVSGRLMVISEHLSHLFFVSSRTVHSRQIIRILVSGS
jgi:DNA polymerase iota